MRIFQIIILGLMAIGAFLPVDVLMEVLKVECEVEGFGKISDCDANLINSGFVLEIRNWLRILIGVLVVWVGVRWWMGRKE